MSQFDLVSSMSATNGCTLVFNVALGMYRWHLSGNAAGSVVSAWTEVR